MGANQQILLSGSTGGVSVDPYFASVVCLCHFNGTNGSQTFVQSSPLGSAITATGANAVLSTAQAQFGTASLSLPGTTGHYVDSTDTDYDFNSDFTIELSIYTTSNGTGATVWLYYDSNIAGGDPAITNIAGSMGIYHQGALALYPSGTLVLNSWNQVCISRSGVDFRWFINGTLTGTQSTSGANSGGGAWRLGQKLGFTAGAWTNPTCFIDELRITAGVARYTANYTPDTAAFPDS